ncbi:uncharacterized protein LOC133874365 [Alnus glutinosa]|uniref:uncharacterized protein LOC133874365 n=1 Tax=Alnus glutinosa TaxID=3517 RepID=UPI002D79B556|nr:uncharacterized protein LOC133874365 [Alnus glutinosa]
MESQYVVSINEIEKFVKIEAGEGSNSHDGPATIREERIKMLMEAEAEINNREERIKMLMEAEAQMKAVEKAKIQNVIFLLRDHKNFVKYFEPRVASLGPIHHGNSKYQLGEKYKLLLASKFIRYCSGNNKINLYDPINCLYEKIKKEIKDLRECFEEKVTTKYDDESLAWILFVDGCAILQYIFCAANDKFKEFNIKNDSVAFAQQDLFLLENQVPYCLLKLLMSSSGKEDELRKSIEGFIRNVTYQKTKPQQNVKKGESSHDLQPKPIETEPTHLLDLLRTKLLDPPQSSGKTRRCSWTRLLGDCRKFFGKMCREKQEEDPDWRSYRNVQELKAAGIQLKRSKNSYLRNVSFSRRFGFYPGFLWLPPITVDDSTGSKFMNLIAYEMCLDFKNDFGIISYISFLLDSLIDEPNDVKYMRKARVLHHFLGSDQQVVELFHEIGTNLVPNPESYKDVNFQIQDYYKNHMMIWTAEVFNKSFSNPMSIVTFLGTVVFALALTSIQTWYAVFPSPGPCDDVCKLKLE